MPPEAHAPFDCDREAPMRRLILLDVVLASLVGGLPVACGKGPTEPTPLRNRLPVGGTITMTPTGVGMAGVTTFSFNSNAKDEDKDPLAYSWDFGDGGTGTGATTTHIYTETGAFNVTLSVSDGKESVAPTGIAVTVAPSVTGTWKGGRNPFFPSSCEFSFTATQDGNALTGSISFTDRCSGPSVTLASGSVDPLTHPSTVTWISNAFPFAIGTVRYENMSLRFAGTTNSAGTSMIGTSQVLLDGIAGPRLPASTTFTR